MKNRTTMQPTYLLPIGFIFLFIGIFLTLILEADLWAQILGLVLIIVSSALFGASIRINLDRKK